MNTEKQKKTGNPAKPRSGSPGYRRSQRYRGDRRYRRKNSRPPYFLWILAAVCILAAAAIRFSPYIAPYLTFFEQKDAASGPDTGNTETDFAADAFSESTCSIHPERIPDFDGADYAELNGNRPNFTEYDRTHLSGETYSDLDLLGRCGSAVAMLDRSMMPSEERGFIGEIRPSGWHTVKYPELIEDNYLYNRCHLISYAMTGQNDNPRNLITGTRHMNTEGMLPFEILVLKYLDHSDNHVLYRVTPFFRGLELVARGVEMEAWSVEDEGEGVCFHVFVYNHQPGIVIDYLTGDSRESSSGTAPFRP